MKYTADLSPAPQQDEAAPLVATVQMLTDVVLPALQTVWVCRKYHWGRSCGSEHDTLSAYYNKEQALAQLEEHKLTWEQEAKRNVVGAIHEHHLFEMDCDVDKNGNATYSYEYCNMQGSTSRFVSFYVECIDIEA